MKNFLLLVLSLGVAVALGIALGRAWPGVADERAAAGAVSGSEREILYWKAPMDPNFRSDSPGKSPMGMDLVPVYADEAAGAAPGVVAIDPMVVNNLGVRTALAKRGALPRRIETVGYIGFDEDTLRQVSTRVDGWVEKLSVKAEGDPVRRGQVLFELYSPTLVNAQEEYLTTLRSNNGVLQKASRARLSALGVTASEINRLDKERTVRQRLSIVAKADGVLTHLGIREGSHITPATAIMAIASLDSVWVLAEVFERQAAWVGEGQTASVELDYLPGRRWNSAVDYVYPELDARTRTLKVRLRLANVDGALRPNMFARVRILGTEAAPVVHIPREALIRGGTGDRVVLALGEGHFRSRMVEAGYESGDRVEIRSGLVQGDRIVTSAQFLIDSESNIDSALERMDMPAADRPPGHDHKRLQDAEGAMQ